MCKKIDGFVANTHRCIARYGTIVRLEEDLRELSSTLAPVDVINTWLLSVADKQSFRDAPFTDRIVAYSCEEWSLSLIILPPSPLQSSFVDILPMNCLLAAAAPTLLHYELFVVEPNHALLEQNADKAFLKEAGAYSAPSLAARSAQQCFRLHTRALTAVWCLIDRPTCAHTWRADTDTGRIVGATLSDADAANAVFKLGLFHNGIRLSASVLADLMQHPLTEVRSAAMGCFQAFII